MLLLQHRATIKYKNNLHPLVNFNFVEQISRGTNVLLLGISWPNISWPSSPYFEISINLMACTGQPVNFVTPVKFVTCRKNTQGQAIFTFK